MDNLKIGQFLKELRTREGKSQRDIAAVCNVSHQAVSKWEKGESIPDISSLQSLSDYYRVTINDILAGEQTTILSEVKPFNNRNKEIIKITMTIFMFLVPFLPFYNDSGTMYTGYDLMIKGDIGLGMITTITLTVFFGFQIIFSLFTIFRIISFTRANAYLIRSIVFVLSVLVYFSFAISAIYPYPFMIYAVYLFANYMVQQRVLQQMDMSDEYEERQPRYEPYVYLLVYFVILSVIPLYLFIFDDWFQGTTQLVFLLSIFLYVASISVFIYGFIKRRSKVHAYNSRMISMYTMRILYLIFFYLMFTEQYFLNISENSYDGIMYIVIYLSFELFISTRYAQTIRLKDEDLIYLRK